MAISQKEEARALSADERVLVVKSHHPALQELPDQELSSLVRLMRERRDKAQGQAERSDREIRGKAEPRGVTPPSSNEGSKVKVAVLAMAMRRLNSETERRRQIAARTSLVENAKKALSMKIAVETKSSFNSRHAHEGMRSNASARNESLVRPMELGRQRKAASVAQAKRDGR